MSGASSFAPKRLNLLKETFGAEIELVSDNGATELYRIKAEFQLGDARYAALQNEALRAEDEVELLRIAFGSDGSPQLETIDDEVEWEFAAEAYDDLLFADDERP